MGSDTRSHRSWRQKGLAAALSGAILLPIIHSTVKETFPEGLLGYLSREQPIERVEEATRPPFDAQARDEEAPIPFTYATRSTPVSPESAYRLAQSVLNLDEDIDTIARTARTYHVPENLLITIAAIESLGGAQRIPTAYSAHEGAAQIPAGVSAGIFHAKLTSLEEAVNAGGSMRTALAEHGIDLGHGWPTQADLSERIPEEVYAELLERAPSPEHLVRSLQLAAQAPQGPIANRLDTEESARGAIAYIAQIDAHLESVGIEEPSLAQILAGYTGGHNGVRHAVTGANDDTIGRAVANNNGEWYTRTGEQVHALLEAYGSPYRALEAARELESFRSERPDATIAILGELYRRAATDPDAIASFDTYIVDQRAADTTRWVTMAEIWDSYTDASTFASR